MLDITSYLLRTHQEPVVRLRAHLLGGAIAFTLANATWVGIIIPGVYKCRDLRSFISISTETQDPSNNNIMWLDQIRADLRRNNDGATDEGTIEFSSSTTALDILLPLAKEITETELLYGGLALWSTLGPAQTDWASSLRHRREMENQLAHKPLGSSPGLLDLSIDLDSYFQPSALVRPCHAEKRNTVQDSVAAAE
jgi:hypothetical protein